MMIPYLPLNRITAMHADEIHEAVANVIDSGWYLRGEATERFEDEYARYIGTKHCIGVANGLDALTLMLRAYKEMGVLCDGDEILCQQTLISQPFSLLLRTISFPFL